MKIKALYFSGGTRCSECNHPIKYAWLLNFGNVIQYFCNRCRDHLHQTIKDTLDESARDRYVGQKQ